MHAREARWVRCAKSCKAHRLLQLFGLSFSACSLKENYYLLLVTFYYSPLPTSPPTPTPRPNAHATVATATTTTTTATITIGFATLDGGT